MQGSKIDRIHPFLQEEASSPKGILTEEYSVRLLSPNIMVIKSLVFGIMEGMEELRRIPFDDFFSIQYERSSPTEPLFPGSLRVYIHILKVRKEGGAWGISIHAYRPRALGEFTAWGHDVERGSKG
jgi:hypothetical protein